MHPNCTSCGSSHTRTAHPRSKLTYICCGSCGHCEQIQAEQDASDAFEAAQEKYYGVSSLLLLPDPDPFETELLSKRFSVLESYLKSPSKVLEVGPGAGHVLKWLLSNRHSTTAVEHSPTLARQLSNRFTIPVVTGEFESSDLEPNSFDAFCSFHVIEHVPDPLAHLTKAFELVRPGGLAFIATPNARSLEQIAFQSLSPNFDSAHTFVFSPNSLAHFSENAGWSVLSCMTPEYSSGWLRVITKAIRRLKREDEEETAGKYAKSPSTSFHTIASVAKSVMFPICAVQGRLGYGNEIFMVLKKSA